MKTSLSLIATLAVSMTVYAQKTVKTVSVDDAPKHTVPSTQREDPKELHRQAYKAYQEKNLYEDSMSELRYTSH